MNHAFHCLSQGKAKILSFKWKTNAVKPQNERNQCAAFKIREKKGTVSAVSAVLSEKIKRA